MTESTSTTEAWGGNSPFQLLTEECKLCIGQALPAKFQAENAAKCFILEPKISKFFGGACPRTPLAGSGFALA